MTVAEVSENVDMYRVCIDQSTSGSSAIHVAGTRKRAETLVGWETQRNPNSHDSYRVSMQLCADLDSSDCEELANPTPLIVRCHELADRYARGSGISGFSFLL